MLGARGVFRCARTLSTTAATAQINSVSVIGAGLMGNGIAQVNAQANLNTVVVDTQEKQLKKAQEMINQSVQRVAKKKFSDANEAKKFIDGTLSKLKFVHATDAAGVAKGIEGSDLIVEAIVENLDAKHKLLAQVEPAIKKGAIIATNTSSLKLADIGKHLKNRQNFGGLHFFNPVPVMKLLEVVRHSETTDETFNAMKDWGKRIGKVTVACKDTPGFIVNRLLVPYMFEALRMAERGDASIEDIDIAMKLGAGYPMLCDYVGLDTTKFIIDGWHKNYPDEPAFKPSPWLNRLVKEGNLGRKTGKGFFDYTKK